MEELPSSKRCPRCGRTLPAHEFHTVPKQRRRPDGSIVSVPSLASWCRGCKATDARDRYQALRAGLPPRQPPIPRPCDCCNEERVRLKTIAIDGRPFGVCKVCYADLVDHREAGIAFEDWLPIRDHLVMHDAVESLWQSDHRPRPDWFAAHASTHPAAPCPPGYRHSTCVQAEARARRVYDFLVQVAGQAPVSPDPGPYSRSS